MKSIFNALFFQKHFRFLTQTYDWMRKHPSTMIISGLVIGFLVLSQFVACEGMNFQHGVGNPALYPTDDDGSSCSDVDPRKYINSECEVVSEPDTDGGKSGTEWTSTVHLGKVDILFVIDNSSSMYEEHQNIASQIKDFLKDIRDLDYRLAMITVDISSSPGNTRRRFQDGRFIGFRDGSIFLSNSEEGSGSRFQKHSKNRRMFEEAIVREETANCDDEDSKECPTDERAICALNMALERDAAKPEGSTSKFIRTDPDVHLMVVILSDEDERSSQEFIERQLHVRGGEDYMFESCDEPETFYVNVYNLIGPLKSYSIHSIIVPPDDEDCYNQQVSEDGSGAYGEVYAEFAEPSAQMINRHPGLRDGSVISICDRSYADQLSQLSSYLQIPRPITLHCNNPSRVMVTVGSDQIRHRVEGNTVILEERVPIDRKLTVKTQCGQAS